MSRVGRVAGGDRALAVPAEPASGLIPSGFDPSRDGLSVFWRHKVIAQILDLQERENGSRDDFTPAISREVAERAINALLDIFDCRSSATAAAYGWVSLWSVLGIDFWASKLVFKPRDSDGSPEGEDANAAPSRSDDSAGPEGIAQGDQS